MKKLLFIAILFCLTQVKAQTNVSGGIYSNTTWSLANSPYIVIDTVVVFPGVTLTIQPGVTVKFKNNKRLEVRQSKIIAIGTSIDSITFTSDSVAPSRGIWSSIFINPNSTNKLQKFIYCNFSYADNAIQKEGSDSLLIKHSSFKYNNAGIGNNTHNFIGQVQIDSSVFKFNGCGIGSFYTNPYGTRVFSSIIANSDFSNNQQAGAIIGYSSVINCTLNSNQTGIFENDGNNMIKNCIINSNSAQGYYSFESNFDTIINCQIMYNNIGIFDNTNAPYSGNVITKNTIENNSIGIKLFHTADTIYCNTICSNSVHDLQYIGTSNTHGVIHNNWCTSDSTSTEMVIYDGFDNTSYGLVFFMPNDSLCPPSSITSSIKNIKSNFLFNVYPNPTQNNFTIQTSSIEKQTINVFDISGKLVLSQNINGTTNIDVNNLNAGVYNISITNSEGATNKRLVIIK
jgi:hypothetical protein